MSELRNTGNPALTTPAASRDRVRFFTLGSAFEAIRRVLAWPPDASYESQYANARKALNELHERLSESERKRYDAEREVERLQAVVKETP